MGEYLQQLSVRQKCLNEQPALEIGDVVLISEDEVSARGKRRLGRVDELLPGKDGLIRTVILKTKKRLLWRPVQRLHRLKASSAQFVSGCITHKCNKK